MTISLKKLDFDSFWELNSIPEPKLKFAVIVAEHKGKLVFVKHKERDTFEIPGGKREQGERIDIAARRELKEETGAKKFKIEPVAIYRIKKNNSLYFGKLYYAEIFEFSTLPNMEIREVLITNNIPKELTYPLIQPHILEKVELFLKEKHKK